MSESLKSRRVWTCRIGPPSLTRLDVGVGAGEREMITKVTVFLSASLTLYHGKLLHKAKLFTEKQTERE